MRMFFKISILIILALASCNQEDDSRIIILYDRVDELQIGSAATIQGVTVGKVSKLDLADSGVLVTVDLKGDQKIPVRSAFTINRPLIGPTSIVIEPSAESKYLAFPDTAFGSYTKALTLDEFLADSTRRKAVEKILKGFQDLIESFKDSSGQKRLLK
jgi:ABC-type transporter Mla subunit MlaD